MMKKYLGLILGLTVMLSCTSNENKSTQTADSTVSEETAQVSGELQFEDDNTAAVYSAYLTLKNALVNSQFEEAKQAAKALSPVLKAYPGCENTAITAGKIAQAKDIAGQREAFTALSTDVIALFKHASLKKGTIYVQHCPMANDGNGGDWLASEKKIQNPYYGSEMMECGAVTEEIKAP